MVPLLLPERISNFVSTDHKSFHFCFGSFGKSSALEVVAEVLDRVHIRLPDVSLSPCRDFPVSAASE